MAKCVWPLLVTCVCSVVVAQVRLIEMEIPMSDAARGVRPNRFAPAMADDFRETLGMPSPSFTPPHPPAPFELLTIRPARAMGNPLVSAATLRHKVPKDAKKAFDRGIQALQKGDIERAMDHLQKAVALDEEYAAAHGNLGVALVRQQRLAEAEVAIRRAIALDPHLPMAQSNLAWVLAGLGRKDEAQAMARRALEESPDNGPARNLLDQLGR